MLVVAAELGVSTLERRVSVGLGLVDTVCAFALVSCSFIALRILSRMLFVRATVVRSRWAIVDGGLRTRSCEPSCSGCAETSSLTLRENQYAIQFQRATRLHILAMATV